MLDDLAADMQDGTAALKLVCRRVAYLPEFAENLGLVLRADGPAAVAHVDLLMVVHFMQSNLSRAGVGALVGAVSNRE